MCAERLTSVCVCVSLVLQNCIDKTAEWMKSNLTVVLGVAFGIAILLVSARMPPSFTEEKGGGVNTLTAISSFPQIFGMVMAMMLYHQIGRKDGATATA